MTWLRRRLVTLMAVVLSAALLASCDQPEPAPLPPEAQPAPTPAPTPDEPAADVEEPQERRDFAFSRIEGITTAGDFGPFGAEDLQRWQDEVPDIEHVQIPSSADDHRQPALWLPPNRDGSQPLLVVLHSWSSAYQQHLGIPFALWAQEHGWGMIHPNFRGVFETPEATGSDLAVQDVLDAVDFAVEEAEIDEDLVFVIGFSGGGMMSLLMAGRHPERFAGAVSWVPVYDLVDWYLYSLDYPDRDYPQQIVASCGGDPTADQDARGECRHRSPRTHIEGAEGVPVYIGQGMSDTIVPPDYAFRAFNDLADPADRVGDDVLQAARERRLVSRLRGEVEAETYFGGPDPQVFFSRSSGPVTLVAFEGGHDMVYHPGLEWITEVASGRVP
jgi:acetyl esterase/lipase